MNGKVLVLRRSALMVVLLAAFLLPASVGATIWCGQNGLIRFSFVEGDSLVTVLHTEEPTDGVTTFDLYAWLTDVDPVAKDGKVFLQVGGIEFELSISGDEAFILEQEFPSQVLNIGTEMGQVVAGLVPGEMINDGKVFLVRWKVMIQGRPENVRIGLDPTGLMSCAGFKSCEESEPAALYVGNESNWKVGVMFGAGYVPSWLNPVGEPDQTPVTGKGTWREVGVFTEP